MGYSSLYNHRFVHSSNTSDGLTLQPSPALPYSSSSAASATFPKTFLLKSFTT
jgi:hypothetical protein